MKSQKRHKDIAEDDLMLSTLQNTRRKGQTRYRSGTREKAANMVVQNPASDRPILQTMLFNFLNYPQPLEVWIDRTGLCHTRRKGKTRYKSGTGEKAANMVVQNPTFDWPILQTMLFNFPNYPQPLEVWIDRTGLCHTRRKGKTRYRSGTGKKAANKVVQNPASDRPILQTMLFNFPNYPQPLEVWINRTGLRPRK